MLEEVQYNEPGTRQLTDFSGNGAIMGVQCWFLLLAKGASRGGYSKIVLG